MDKKININKYKVFKDLMIYKKIYKQHNNNQT